MERKLVKQGQNALTITLPAKWLKEKNLKAGDVVFLDQSSNEIKISAKTKNKNKEITIDVRGFDRSLIWHNIQSKYVDGYDKIILMHNSRKTIMELNTSFIGMIIEENTATKFTLKNIIVEPETNTQSIIRRILHMFEQQAAMLEELTQNKTTIDEIKQQERLIDTNIIYCLRCINKYNLQQDAYKKFLLCATIEEAADIITNIAKHINQKTELAKIIKQGISSYNKYLHTENLPKLYAELREFRNKIPNKKFLDGLTFQLAETLYNNIGYLMSKHNER